MARTWRSKHYCPPPFGTNKIMPIPIKADDVTGATTNWDPVPNKRMADNGNSVHSPHLLMPRTWRSKYYIPLPPVKEDATADITGTTTNRDPIPRKRKIRFLVAHTWKSKYNIPLPVKEDATADVSCVTGSTTVWDPLSKKRKTEDVNSIASDDLKEYDEPASKKTKTVDHNGIASVDSTEYNEPLSNKRKTLDDNGIASVDSKEYNEPISNKIKTVDDNGIASVDSKEYNEPVSNKIKTVEDNVCKLSEDLKRELSKLYRVPLQDGDWTSWLKFTNHAKRAKTALREVSRKLVEQKKKSIGVNHPFVHVIGEFAVSTFNKLHEMLVKKGDHNNIRGFEIMKCQYLHMRVPKHYFIYLTIEAFEKGKLGVYEAKVVCYKDDGRRTLTKFVLTDRRPVGKKAMAMSPLSRLISVYKSVEGLEKDIETYLKTAQQSKKGAENGNVAAEFCRLKTHYKKALEGLGKVLSRDTQAPARNPTTNQDTSGMVSRTKGTTCKGYDYYNPLREFGTSLLW